MIPELTSRQDVGALPLIVRVLIRGVSDPGEIDTEVYCVNTTPDRFALEVRSSSFTTIDEEEGTVVKHGSGPIRGTLAPGAAVRVGQVRGWEWDGYVGLEVEYANCATGIRQGKSYSLKNTGSGYRLPGTDTDGFLVPSDTVF